MTHETCFRLEEPLGLTESDNRITGNTIKLDCILDGAAPSLAAALSQADEERSVWEMAGAKGISSLMAQLQEA
jgi:hypothetical protein